MVVLLVYQLVMHRDGIPDVIYSYLKLEMSADDFLSDPVLRHTLNANVTRPTFVINEIEELFIYIFTSFLSTL
ncbi:hypothetical protein KIN20_014177 [Parelaphostrongylus tenuis]|uniref:Uncharacterized protein n=1 Tax=Parelaphostrongylus tenuis TaxID=148309 RepID=A0AAD5MX10_PARTN|nr:hypothetical protein KIN20_014177 [Parelaphostrongylus tenuis]